MKSKLVLVSALAAGLMNFSAVAQAAGPQAPAAASAPASVPPQAVPAKIALIEFEQVAAATNEGQRALLEVQKKYEPKKAQLDALAAEIDTLTKQLQAAPATMPEDEKASKARTLDTKQKQYQRDGEDASAAYNADVQDAIAKVGQKLGPVVLDYVKKNGFTMLLDVTGQQGGAVNVLWSQDGSDISQAIVDAYNASSGVAAPVPSAPSASRPRPAAPAAGTAPKPATTTTPRPATTTPAK
jgi:outer membrane protein